MAFALSKLSHRLRDLSRKASDGGTRLIARAQRHESLSAVVQDGTLEGISSTSMGGVGLHTFLESGSSALGAIDRLDGEGLSALLERTCAAGRSVEDHGLDPVPQAAETDPLCAEIPAPGGPAFREIATSRFRSEISALGSQVYGEHKDLAVRVAGSFGQDEWRIVRWDGSDIGFVVPRARVMVTVTARAAGGAITQHDYLSSSRLDFFGEDATRETVLQAARGAAGAARALVGAPPPPGGSHPLLIDHALAKGLAHEAFGHAAEADSFRTSILARDERFRRGERVGSDRISIIDEPIVGDHAYQPVSAHGVIRRKTVIVRSGILDEALTDLFSARDCNMPLRGSARAQDFASPPIPRMSNIRIEMVQPRPLPAPRREVSAETLRDLLGDAGIFERHPEVVYLSGYTGGQVNPKTGAFVFNSLLSYRLRPDAVEVCQPAVFSGSALAALRSIDEAFGDLVLDAIGQCGKAGQQVPSSGGSHAFLYLEPNDEVLVGGRSGP